MRHYPTDNGGHYAVAPEASGLGVLVQIMEGPYLSTGGMQARELLTTEEARAMAYALLDTVQAVENRRKTKRHHKDTPEGEPCTCGQPVDAPIHLPRIDL
jgi:hypothetical protein